MTENQEKARTSVRNVASAWNRGKPERDRIKNEIIGYRDYVVKVSNAKGGKAKKHYSFGTTEYKHKRIL